jgi:D-sedoheptulose 7-phosphate isomerase
MAEREGSLFRRGFAELAELIADGGSAVAPILEHVARRATACLDNGGKILVAGNGGSAAEAQHFAAELVGRFLHDRPALPAIALTCDTSTLTAIGNDYGFERVFERQVEALGQPGDLLLLLSTSGNSANVIAAAVRAREKGCLVVAFTGAGGGRLANLADVLLAVPSESVSRIQEVHLICLHLLAGYLESNRFRKQNT